MPHFLQIKIQLLNSICFKKLKFEVWSVDQLLKNKKVKLFAPIVNKRKGTYKELANWALTRNYNYIRVDNILYEVKHFPDLERYKEHSIELHITDMVIKSNNTEWIQEKIREGLDIGKGQIELEIANHVKPNKIE